MTSFLFSFLYIPFPIYDLLLPPPQMLWQCRRLSACSSVLQVTLFDHLCSIHHITCDSLHDTDHDSLTLSVAQLKDEFVKQLQTLTAVTDRQTGVRDYLLDILLGRLTVMSHLLSEIGSQHGSNEYHTPCWPHLRTFICKFLTDPCGRES